MKRKIVLICLLIIVMVCQSIIFTFDKVFASEEEIDSENDSEQILKNDENTTNAIEMNKNNNISSNKATNSLDINFKNFNDSMSSENIEMNADEREENIKEAYEEKLQSKEKIRQIKEKNEKALHNNQRLGSTAQNEQVQEVTIQFKDVFLFRAIMDELEDILISYDEETYTIVINQDNLNSIEELNLGTYGWTSSGNSYGWNGAYIEDFSGLEKFVNLKDLTVGIAREVKYVDFTPIETLKKLESLRIGNNLNNDFRGLFNINHLAENFPNLKSLDIIGVHNININHVEWPTTLEDIWIDNCSFVEQPIADWSMLENLKELKIRRTNLSTIQDIKFPKNIEEIELDDNQLTNIDNVNFGNQLTYIDLQNNQIEDISKVKFPNTLEDFIIGENRLKSIDSLKENTNLRILSISGNNIEDIKVVENFTNLTNLYAGTWSAFLSSSGLITGGIIDKGNNIKDIQNIKWPESIRFIDLSGNEITSIDNVVFPKKASEIWLNENKIQEIKNFTVLENQKVIKLEDNQLVNIAGLKFEPTSETRYLKLSNNQISNFIGVDWTNASMEEIDVDYNHLTTLENLPSELKTLVANNNQITDISNANWEKLSIDSLDLSSNQIKSVTNIQWNNELRYLILSDNEIADISHMKATDYMKALELRENNISDISVFANEEWKDLQGLNLYANHIKDISSLKNLTNLSQLLLGKNQIENLSILENIENLNKVNAESQYYIYRENLISIPNALAEATKENSKMFAEEITYHNCELKDGKINVIDKNHLAIITLNTGNAEGTNIYIGLEGKLQGNIYKISTKENLQELSDLSQKGVSFYGLEIQMDNSIDMGAYYDVNENIWKGDIWKPIGTEDVPFDGIFNGNLHEISGIVTDSDSEISGIFGVSTGTIKNLSSKNNYIDGYYAGGIVGYIYKVTDKNSGIIQNCYNNSFIHGVLVGGIAGRGIDADISNTCNLGMVAGTYSAGGIIGGHDGIHESGISGTLKLYNVYNAGTILTRDETDPRSGIFGNTKGSNVRIYFKNVYNVGEVVQGTQLISEDSKEDHPIFENCYVINMEEFENTMGVSEINQNIASQILNILNANSENADDWKMISNYAYPVLKWQTQEQFQEENKNLSVYAINHPNEPTNQDVTVTIYSNKKMKQNDGWKILQDGYMQTKTFSESEEMTLYVEDLSGNAKPVEIDMDIYKRQISIEDLTIEYTKIADDYIIMKIKSKKGLKPDLDGLFYNTISSTSVVYTVYKIYYSDNLEDVITLEDKYGNKTEIKLPIGVDNTAPELEVQYSTKNPTKENVTVTITANEEIQEVEGWTLSADKRTLTKEYAENTTETVIVKDLAGNEQRITIDINNIQVEPEIIVGDINHDSKIDITDIILLKRHLIAENRANWILTGDKLEAADMNENGKVDISDLLLLKREIVEDL